MYILFVKTKLIEFEIVKDAMTKVTALHQQPYHRAANQEAPG